MKIRLYVKFHDFESTKAVVFHYLDYIDRDHYLRTVIDLYNRFYKTNFTIDDNISMLSDRFCSVLTESLGFLSKVTYTLHRLQTGHPTLKKQTFQKEIVYEFVSVYVTFQYSVTC